jgi:Right handed beta helix region
VLTTTRSRVLRSLVAAGVVTGLVVTAQPAFAHGGGGRADLYVEPGESIQAAADLAASGDTIRLAAGEFHEAVCIVGKGLTIIGAGRNMTTILPPATAPGANECWSLAPPPTAPGQPPEDGYSALHFEDPDRRVTVTRLSTEGHPGSGIVAHGATGFTVTNTSGTGHGLYGILAAEGSTKIRIVNNVETGVEGPPTRPGGPRESGTAGISVGDTGDANAVVAHNTSTGWNLGIFAREARDGSIVGNTTSGNCIGVLVFDDSSTESLTPPANFAGGDWKLIANKSTANNRFCLAGPAGNQLVSGVGMALVNVDDMLVTVNRIADNSSTAPQPQEGQFPFPTAGLVVLSLPAFTPPPDGVLPPPAENIKVIANRFSNNDLDIFEGAISVPIPGVPPTPAPVNISYVANSCTTSVPPTICGAVPAV